MDPGLPGVAVVSPVTGRSVTVSALEEARRNASVGEFDPTRTLIEARALILPWIEATEGVHLALRLPGPVVTEQGKSPRKLCEELVLGLTESEILLVDADSLHAQPARIRLSSLTAMKSVAHGFQVSLALGEGKQVHLDLRSLQRDSSRVADTAIRLIADALRRQGGSD